VAILLLALLPAVSTLQPFRINFNFGRRGTSSLTPGGSGAPSQNESQGIGPTLAPQGPVESIPPGALVDTVALVDTEDLQQVHIPITIPARDGIPAQSVNLVVMAPRGMQVRHSATVQLAAAIYHHHSHLHQQQVQHQIPHQHTHPHHLENSGVCVCGWVCVSVRVCACVCV